MSYKEYKPSDELKMFIKCFWIMEKDYSINSRNKGLEVLWPTGLTEILYTIGNKFKYLNGEDEEILSNEIIIGAYNKRFILRNEGKVKIIGVRCYNHGANTLFNVDLNSLINKINKYELRDIDEEILYSKDNNEIVDYLNRYCSNFIRNDEFSKVLHKIYTEDNISLQELAKESNLSLRQFERKVKKFTGFTPKQLVTIVRFDRARKTMLFTKDYIQVMTDLGYYDYSHFSKDFKKYFSITPKEFIDIYNRY